MLVEEKLRIDDNCNTNEVSTKGSSKIWTVLQGGLKQLKPLLKRPLSVTMLLVVFIHFGMLAG